MVNQRDTVVTRIKKKHHTKLLSLANKKNVTMLSLLDKAILNYLEENEYDFEDLTKVIENIPTLQLHKNLLTKEFEGCPSSLCKKIILVIKDKEAFMFKENEETIREKIKSLNKTNLYGIFIHISQKKLDINQITETVKTAQEFLDDKVKFGADARENPDGENKIIMLVSYNQKQKEEKQDGR